MENGRGSSRRDRKKSNRHVDIMLQAPKLSSSSLIGAAEFNVLETIFHRHAEKGSVDKAGFKAVLGSILDISDDDLVKLFFKVDANADLRVTWDEIVEYLLHEGTVVTSMEANIGAYTLNTTPANPIFTHLDSIERMSYLPELDVLATCSRDSSLILWDIRTQSKKYELFPLSHLVVPRALSASLQPAIPSLRQPKVRAHDNKPIKPKPGTSLNASICPLDSHYIHAVRKLFVCNVDKSISVHDARRMFKEVEAFEVPGLPMCITHIIHPHTKQPVLVIGLSTGSVVCYKVATQAGALQGDMLCAIHVCEGPITRVVGAGEVGILVTSLSGVMVAIELDKWTVERTYKGHARSIFCCAYASTYRLIATGGLDRKLTIWNPYVTKPTWLLEGHHDSIVEVIINELHNQIISLSADKHIRIWDIRRMDCLQTLYDDCLQAPDDRLTAACMDFRSHRLITGGSQIRFWPVDQTQDLMRLSNAPAHEYGVTALLYSGEFNQFITVDNAGHVKLWAADTGKFIFTFHTGYAEGGLAGACLDSMGRRLFVCGYNGVVAIWNFNNGFCIRTFENVNAEIGCICFVGVHGLRRPISVGCWDYRVIMLSDREGVHGTDIPPRILKGHEGDVNCLCALGSLVLSGGADGLVCVWLSESGQLHKAVRLPDNEDGTSPVVEVMLATPASSILIVGVQDGTMHFLWAKSGRPLCLNGAHFPGGIASVAVNADETLLLVGDCLGSCHLLDFRPIAEYPPAAVPLTTACRIIRQWKASTTGVSIGCCLWVPSLQLWSTADAEGRISLWNERGKLLEALAMSTVYSTLNVPPRPVEASSTLDVRRDKRRKSVIDAADAIIAARKFQASPQRGEPSALSNYSDDSQLTEQRERVRGDLWNGFTQYKAEI
jgi:WD40 repeat protein